MRIDITYYVLLVSTWLAQPHTYTYYVAGHVTSD